MTFRAGVIGSPVLHSLSPRFHEATFRFLGIEGASERREMTLDGVRGFDGVVKDFDALSVTMPLKEALVPFCNQVDDRVMRTGALNSLRRHGDLLEGRNFDGDGLVRGLREDFDVEVAGASVTLLGAGGAARSVLASLLDSNASRIEVVIRHGSRHRAHPLLSAQNITVVTAPQQHASVVINATPVSMLPGDPSLPLVPSNADSLCVDLVYRPAVTPWMDAYRSRGCRVANGLSMLTWQAKLQLDWWFDADIPITVLREVAD